MSKFLLSQRASGAVAGQLHVENQIGIIEIESNKKAYVRCEHKARPDNVLPFIKWLLSL